MIKRLKLIENFDQYKVRGIFISNVEIDANGEAYLAITPSIEFIKTILESTFISNERIIPQNQIAEFDIAGLNISKHFVDASTLAYIIPIKANELVKMSGMAKSVRLCLQCKRTALGGTNVNRDIVKSIKDKSLHKKFPLFHNGITIVANKITELPDAVTPEKLSIDTFFVVNGCQSLTALYNNKKELTDDLRILTKFVQVSVDSDLSKTITQFSNNQNGVKARDFKSNNIIQVRLQNEFRNVYGTQYFYEIKRGEVNTTLITISNEVAGIHLMSFDLKEPWGTHRKYQVFDDKYTDIFGRPEVSAHRILMLHLIDQIIISKIPSITNQLVAKYALTRFAIMFILRQILECDKTGKELLTNPEYFVKTILDRTDFIDCATMLIKDIIIDFNGEVKNLGDDFDYKSKLRDEVWIKKLSQEIVSSYLKQVSRERIDSFEIEWAKKIASRV